MNDFVLTPAAEDDLRAIDAHLAAENPAAAERVSQALEAAMEVLAKYPLLGHLRGDLTARLLRFWTVFSYMIVYRPDTSPVQIVRVVHGARDLRTILNR